MKRALIVFLCALMVFSSLNQACKFALVPEAYASVTTSFTVTSDDTTIQYSSTSWDFAHHNVTGSATGTTSNIVGTTYATGLKYIQRCVLPWDSSSIPDDAVVIAAWITINVTTATGAGQQQSVCITRDSTYAYPHLSPTTADYGYMYYNQNGGGNTSIYGWATGLHDLTISTVGRTWINKTGVTKWYLQSLYDLNDDSTNSTTAGRRTLFGISTNTAPPRLYVTYKAPPTYSGYTRTNSTQPAWGGGLYNFSLTWTRSGADNNLSKWLFGTNNAGSTYLNTSATTFTNTVTQTVFQTYTLNNTGKYVSVIAYANSTDSVWSSANMTFYVWKSASVFSYYNFGATIGATKNGGIFVNGTKQAIYTAFQNSTALVGSAWSIQIAAYDLINKTWTGRYNISTCPADTHYAPSIDILPSGHLIYLFAYQSELIYRIGTYNAKTETNLTLVISSWSSEYGLPCAHYPVGHGGYTESLWSYPLTKSWSDRLVIIGRDGTAADAEYQSTIYKAGVQWGDAFYVNSYSSTYTAWTEYGASPYLQSGSSHGIFSQTAGQQEGYFRFPDWNSSSQFNPSETIDSLTLYFTFQGSTTVGASATVFYHNATGNYNAGTITYPSTNHVHLESLINTNTKLNATEFWLNNTTPTGSTMNISSASFFFTYTGFAKPETLAYRTGTDTSYYIMDIGSSGNNLLVALAEYNQTYAARTDCYFIYSPDKGETWKHVNGTTLYTFGSGLPGVDLPAQDCIAWESRTMTQYHYVDCSNPVVDENSKPMFIATASERIGTSSYWEFKDYVIQYSTTLGASGSWTNTSALDYANASIYGYVGSMFLDSYYGRPAFWAAGVQSDRKITKYVRVPGNTTRFLGTLTDTTSNYTNYRAQIIQNAPQSYEAASMWEEQWDKIGYYTIAGSTKNMSTSFLYGCKFTANKTALITGFRIYSLSPAAGTTPGTLMAQVGIYSTGLSLLGSTTSRLYKNWAVNNDAGWCMATTFTTAVSVTSGTDYWLVWKMNTTATASKLANNTKFYYAAGGTNQFLNASCSKTANLPSTISSPGYSNWKQTIVAYESLYVVRGTGGDILAPTYSNLATNTTITAAVCKFSAYWTDNVELDYYRFASNISGTFSWDNAIGFSEDQTGAWSNITKTLPASPSRYVIWQIKANDTSNNWGSTGNQTLTMTMQYKVDISHVHTFSLGLNGRAGLGVALLSSITTSLSTLQTAQYALSPSLPIATVLSALTRSTFTLLPSLPVTTALSALTRSTFNLAPAFSVATQMTLDIVYTSFPGTSYIVDLSMAATFALQSTVASAYKLILAHPATVTLAPSFASVFSLTFSSPVQALFSLIAGTGGIVPPTDITGGQTTVTFTCTQAKQPLPDVMITINDATYNDTVAIQTTRLNGKIKFTLAPGDYVYLAGWNGTTKTGRFLHVDYEEFSLDFSPGGVDTHTIFVGFAAKLGILAFLSIVACAGIIVATRRKKV